MCVCVFYFIFLFWLLLFFLGGGFRGGGIQTKKTHHPRFAWFLPTVHLLFFFNFFGAVRPETRTARQDWLRARISALAQINRTEYIVLEMTAAGEPRVVESRGESWGGLIFFKGHREKRNH